MTNPYFSLKTSKVFLIALFFTFFSIGEVSAQEIEKHLVYLSSELNLGNYVGIATDFNYIYEETYTAKFGLNANFRRSPDQPSDYNSGLAGLVTYGAASAREITVDVHLMVGKLYNLNARKTLRVNAAVGVGYTSVETVENWQKTGSNFFSGNYTYDIRSKSTASLIINPKLEIPLGRIFGFTVSPSAILNSESSYYGIGVGYMIGLIRSKPVSK